jgi:translocation and assembly module TamB
MMRAPLKHPKLVAAAALLLALVGLGAWLVATESGLRFVAARALPHLPVTLDPASLRGRLIGPLSVGRVEFAVPGVAGEIGAATLDWRPAALLGRRLHLRAIEVDALRVRLETDAPAGEAAATTRVAGAPALPLAVTVDRLHIRDGRLSRDGETLLDGLDLALAGRAEGKRLELLRVELHSAQGAIEGHARLSLAEGDSWDVDLAWRVPLEAGELAGRTLLVGRLADLALEQRLSGLVVARLEGTVRGLPEAPAWSMGLVVEPLPPRTDAWPEALEGAAARLRLEGRLASQRLEGELQLPRLAGGPVTVRAEAGWAGEALELRQLLLVFADGGRLEAVAHIVPADELATEFGLAGEGLGWPLGTGPREIGVPRLALSGTGAAGRWDLELDGRVEREGLPAVDLEAGLRWQDAVLELHRLTATSPDGELRASATGALDASQEALGYRLEADAEFHLPDTPPMSLSLAGAGDMQGADIETLTAELLGGRLDGAGRIAWAGEQMADFRLAFRDIDPSGLAAGWPGRLAGRLELAGLPATGEGLEILLRELSGELKSLPVKGEATARIAGEDLQLRRATVTLGSTSLQASGRLDEDRIALEAKLEAAALEELQLGARGSLSVTAAGEGPRAAPRLSLEAKGERLGWQAWRARSLDIEADVDLSGAAHSRLHAVIEGLAGAPGPGGRLSLSGEGRPESHRLELAADRGRPAQALRLALEGGVVADGWAGRITTLALAEAEDEIWALREPAELEAGPAGAELGPACMDGTLGLLCLDGRWDRGGPWRGQAVLASLDLGPLSAWAGNGLLASGILAGRVVLSADDEGFRELAGSIGLSAGDLRLAGDETEPLLAWQGGALLLDGDPAEARLALDLDLVGADTFEGRLSVGWNAADPPVEGRLVASLDNLQIITELVPEFAELEGHASLRASLSGSLASPIATGRFEWLEGAAQIPELGIRPRDVEVVAELEEGTLVFRASGRSGDGEFRADGRFDLQAETVKGRATLEGANLLLADLPEARVTASPELIFNYAPGELGIGGEVRVPSARFSGTGGPTAVTASPDEVIVGPRARAEEALEVSSRVRVTVGPDVSIRAAGLRGRVEGKLLTVIQPQVLPWGRGELRVVDGTFSAFGQRLEIETGRLIYTGGPLENPGLEIRAVRKVDEIKAGALVRGTLQQPEISVYSEPPLPRAEVLSYLTLGKSLDQLQAGEQRTVNQAANSLALSGGGLIARDLGRRLGFDEVAVTGDEEGAAVVVSKYLGSGLYVSYGLGLFDTVNTLRLRYQINQRLSLEAASGAEAAADLFYTLERD